jgi:hypothetical protein
VCRGLLCFISYNFSCCLQSDDAVEHINWGVTAPGSMFCPSGRTTVLNDLLGRPFIIFSFANL